MGSAISAKARGGNVNHMRISDTHMRTHTNINEGSTFLLCRLMKRKMNLAGVRKHLLIRKEMCYGTQGICKSMLLFLFTLVILRSLISLFLINLSGIRTVKGNKFILLTALSSELQSLETDDLFRKQSSFTVWGLYMYTPSHLSVLIHRIRA